MKHYFIGTCVNIFDQDGDGFFDAYRDPSELAYSLQNDVVEISAGQFFNNVKYHNEFELPAKMTYLFDNSRDMYIAYDEDTDIHYFYQ